MQTIQSQIRQMPYNEKFIIMEQLWDELTIKSEDNNFTPKWHIDKLNKREERVKNSEAIFSDINDVKNRLKKTINEY
jgi:hypothetical protein